MSVSEENRNVNVPPHVAGVPHVSESVVGPDDQVCSDKPDCEKEELEELQAADSGNQGA